jgi:hypothetical protein
MGLLYPYLYFYNTVRHNFIFYWNILDYKSNYMYIDKSFGMGEKAVVARTESRWKGMAQN